MDSDLIFIIIYYIISFILFGVSKISYNKIDGETIYKLYFMWSLVSAIIIFVLANIMIYIYAIHL